jgi:predicted nucleic acid-binding protein
VRLYLDTSALIKTIHLETETPALNGFLAGQVAQGTTLATSVLTAVEMERGLRALAERGQAAPIRALRQSVDRALEGVEEVRVEVSVIRLARWLGPPLLRTLDAIHLASALLDQADGIVTYDYRLAEAADSMNLAVHEPGRAAQA